MKKLVLFFIICFSVMKGFSQNNFSDFNVPGGFAGGGRSEHTGNIGPIKITTAGEDKIARDFERIFAKIKIATNKEGVKEAIKELKLIWDSMESSERAKFSAAYKQIKKYAKSVLKSL